VLVLSKQNQYAPTGTLGADSFFGEMGYMLSEDRSATIRAKTDVTALALPPRVFENVLKHDASLDRTLVEKLYRTIKEQRSKSR